MIRDNVNSERFRDGWFYVQEHVCAREAISFGDRMGENYNVAERIALIHSEISEALEGIRKNLADDHIPKRPSGEVEFADAIIRMMGVAKVMGWDIPGALLDKADYNDSRADHKSDERSGVHGKAF